MKKAYLILTLLTLIITGCSAEQKNAEQKEVIVYFAKGDSWASTYTLIDAGESIFDSLYIQHIGNRESEMKPIEYELEGNGIKSESQYPQKLQGVRSFQVSTEYNKQLINIENIEGKEFKLTIKQNGKIEELILRLVGEVGNI
jgi:hypothetical protein